MKTLKKVIAVAAVGAMLAVPVAAEAPGVHDLTDDELKALYMDVKQELMDRGIWEGTTLPAGVYVGGEDLPVGTYTCVANKSAQIHIYRCFEDFANQKNMVTWFRVDDNEEFNIKLEEGMCWYIQTSATVRPMVGLDW